MPCKHHQALCQLALPPREENSSNAAVQATRRPLEPPIECRRSCPFAPASSHEHRVSFTCPAPSTCVPRESVRLSPPHQVHQRQAQLGPRPRTAVQPPRSTRVGRLYPISARSGSRRYQLALAVSGCLQGVRQFARKSFVPVFVCLVLLIRNPFRENISSTVLAPTLPTRWP
jgi:hypothetical protein